MRERKTGSLHSLYDPNNNGGIFVASLGKKCQQQCEPRRPHHRPQRNHSTATPTSSQSNNRKERRHCPNTAHPIRQYRYIYNQDKQQKSPSVPSPLMSNMEKASLRSATCSSVSPDTASADMMMLLMIDDCSFCSFSIDFNCCWYAPERSRIVINVLGERDRTNPSRKQDGADQNRETHQDIQNDPTS
jgi:hypothetical protein